MHVECIRNYGADADGRRGVPMLEASLDGSDEECQEIADQICEAIMEGEDVDYDVFEVVFTQDSLPYRFDVSPLDYMDLIIPMVLKEIVCGCDFEELVYFVNLEKALSKAEYKGKSLKQLKEVLYGND